MDREMLKAHLEQAERHVSEGEQHITRQRELIAELERKGRDTTRANELLCRFEEMLALHVHDRDRLRKELG
jgi:hypothetical protein